MIFYDDVGNSTLFLADVRRRQAALLYQYSVAEVVPVADEPIDLETAWTHCRIDAFGSPPASDDDDWLQTVGIPAAREYCEAECGRSFAPRTLELVSNGFPSVQVRAPAGPALYLPLGPVQSVESVIYLDQAAADAAYIAAYEAEFISSGDLELAEAAGEAAAAAALEVTVDPATYQLDTTGPYARLTLAYGATSWPSARNSIGSVRVRYVTGHSLPGDSPQFLPLPARARAAMLLMLCHLYDQRAGTDTDKLAEIPLGVASLLAKLPREDLGMA